MYSLSTILKDSDHKSTLFSDAAIREVESLIFTKTAKSIEVPYIKCQVRGRDIRLTPEEAVRQLYIYIPSYTSMVTLLTKWNWSATSTLDAK